MKQIFIALVFLSTSLYGVASYGKASADLSALPDETRALIMKEKMRASSFSSGNNQAKQAVDSNDPLSRKKTILVDGGVATGCDINIGNSKPRLGANSKPTTVIITGPVIQMPGKGCN